MKVFLLILGLLLSFNMFSQEKTLKVTNIKNKYDRVFKEDKRVRVKTIEGEKFNGKLNIVDKENIMVGDNIIPLAKIGKMKYSPVAMNIIATTIFLGAAKFTGMVTIYIAAWGAYGAAIGGTIITGGILALAFSPVNFYTNSRVKENVIFEVIE